VAVESLAHWVVKTRPSGPTPIANVNFYYVCQTTLLIWIKVVSAVVCFNSHRAVCRSTAARPAKSRRGTFNERCKSSGGALCVQIALSAQYSGQRGVTQGLARRYLDGTLGPRGMQNWSSTFMTWENTSAILTGV